MKFCFSVVSFTFFQVVGYSARGVQPGRKHQIQTEIELMVNEADDFSNNVCPLGAKLSCIEGGANLIGTV